nr:hypothetical protein [Tanacetum cinerariifolium]
MLTPTEKHKERLVGKRKEYDEKQDGNKENEEQIQEVSQVAMARKKEGRTDAEGYMDQIESMMLVIRIVWASASSTTIRVFLRCELDGFLVPTPMEFLDRTMVTKWRTDPI